MGNEKNVFQIRYKKSTAAEKSQVEKEDLQCFFFVIQKEICKKCFLFLLCGLYNSCYDIKRKINQLLCICLAI